MQRQDGSPSGLLILCFDFHGRGIGCEIKGRTPECREFIGTQSGHRRNQIQGSAIGAGQLSEPLRTQLSGVDQPSQFFRVECATLHSDIHLGIQTREMHERVSFQAFRLEKPVSKGLHGDKVVIAGRHAETLLLVLVIPLLLEPVGDLVGIEITEHLESRPGQRGRHS
ncbi:MAG: hypothetical protein U0941_22495 [Planctomycetaceae bacterium]